MLNNIDVKGLFPLQDQREPNQPRDRQLTPSTILENTLAAEQYITAIKGLINDERPMAEAYAAAVACIAKLTNNQALITMLQYK